MSLHLCNFPFIRTWQCSLHSQRFGYEKAIEALNSMQSELKLSRAKRYRFPVHKPNRLLSGLLRCGLRIEDLKERLSVIHVSGTKGKGSTCAYCENILLLSGFKTGLFTSPHLISARERIRINGTPLSSQQFATLFWDLYWKLDHSIKDKTTTQGMANYFTFLTIMAVRAFVEEQVDVAILEVGIGGEYDATNAFDNTAIVGITSLGYDHTDLLGNTIEEIAWQKAGIIKRGSIVICSSDQPIAALKIIKQRAEERKAFLFVAPYLDEYVIPRNDFKLGIGGPVQASNASLAVQLANAWMKPQYYRATTGAVSLVEDTTGNTCSFKKAPAFEMSSEVIRALSFCQLPGRTQILHYSSTLAYYLDGAHSPESMRHCIKWFRRSTSNLSGKFMKALIFNVTGNRDGKKLMEFLLTEEFDYVFFCCNRTAKQSNCDFDNENLFFTEDKEYERITSFRQWWFELSHFDSKKVELFRDVTAAHKYTKNLSIIQEVNLHVLVTGSLHLVGIFLQVLDLELKQSLKVL